MTSRKNWNSNLTSDGCEVPFLTQQHTKTHKCRHMLQSEPRCKTSSTARLTALHCRFWEVLHWGTGEDVEVLVCQACRITSNKDTTWNTLNMFIQQYSSCVLEVQKTKTKWKSQKRINSKTKPTFSSLSELLLCFLILHFVSGFVVVFWFVILFIQLWFFVLQFSATIG